ncbi:MAG TPA: tetraacyldisaccharide 4'-kinase [Candidatus Binataceae bacterium]|nr:tetraacyldisaccharide 4'-kinase [Candidatus Binataceae bacterium]
MAQRNTTGRRPGIERLWERHVSIFDIPAWLSLAAAAPFYRIGAAIRLAFWRKMARAANVTTISVGNLTVGGNSKTPFTLFVANRIQRCGLRVGIVSRGYGRSESSERALLVADRGELKISIEEAGDEPAMMARSFTGPIAVAKRRIDGIELLQSIGDLDAVVLDDGFQHLRLKRDVDLVLVGAERGLGNGWILPAGPMREPIGAVSRADAVILLDSGSDATSLSASQLKRLASRPLLRATVHPKALVSSERGVWREVALPLTGRRAVAISGLADPRGFYATLHELDAELVEVLEYPDHHSYTHADWQNIMHVMRNADVAITTEKDLIKLERFPFARDSLYAIRLAIDMQPDAARALDELIMGRIAGRAEAARA